MSDYRRLSSYIYAYEGDVKGRNVGYARLETRNGQCRIYVSVKRIFTGANDIVVYLLTPESEIAVGRLFVRGGAGEFRVCVDAENVEGSGHSLGECYGLTIHDTGNPWQRCTTVWEDAVACAAQVELAEVTAANVRKHEESVRERQKISQVTASAGQQTGQDAAAAFPAAPHTENAPVTRLPVSAEIERELAQEEAQANDKLPWSGSGAPDPAENSGGPAEMPVPPAPALSAPAQPRLVPRGPEPTEPIGDEKKLAELDRADQAEREAASGKERVWKELQGRCARLRAFDYDHGCEILSIRPQDIGLLPREVWVYGNNSFLLHGYYNHRHLILARLGPTGEQERPRYLLGVPGHYFSNEKAMAAMFGFPRFVLSLNQPGKDARFGYWYTDIRL